MKILVYNDINLDQSVFYLNYLKDTIPHLIPDIMLIDLSHSPEINRWASEQNDYTYVYFEEETTIGNAFNQVISELEINDDILITDCYHIPLVGSYDHMIDALNTESDIFAIGPVSNSFDWEQHIEWDSPEAAITWSEEHREKAIEETLMLQSGVILFSRRVVNGAATFHGNAKTIDNMIVEKCIREHLNHLKMYVCNYSGFYDVRGRDYKVTMYADIDMLEKEFGIHYLNFRGNHWLIDLVKECNDLTDDIKILEVGCDCGGNLFDLKRIYKNARLYGSDINECSLRFASEFAEVCVNNIEDHNLDFGCNDFDLIIFADVLEHLRDPLGAILYCKKLLKKGGRIVTSIPNLMNIEVMRMLLSGDFTYSEVGLLDKTHIHLFTYNEIIRMFVQEGGYTIENMTMNGVFDNGDEQLTDALLKLGRAEKFMYKAYQYQIVARL